MMPLTAIADGQRDRPGRTSSSASTCFRPRGCSAPGARVTARARRSRRWRRWRRKTLPEGYELAWSGAVVPGEDERPEHGRASSALAVLMVFLILAAQYERLTLPFAVILAVPFAVFGAFARGLAARPGQRPVLPDRAGHARRPGGEERDPDRRVRGAHASRRRHVADDAAVEAARLRFRPIVMTSLAFILGVLPLAVSTRRRRGAAATRSAPA